MKVCFVADARSPIAANWISYFIRREYDVTIVSSYPCPPDKFAGARLHQLPIGFSKVSQATLVGEGGSLKPASRLASVMSGLRSGALAGLSHAVQLWASPIELYRHVRALQDLIKQISPDLVHAMRIPFEGILAAKAIPDGCPLLVSVWGNDFTLWADRNPLLARQTRQALDRTDALHCDCYRDMHLAGRIWGFASEKLRVVLPGAGGIQPEVFHRGEPDASLRRQLSIPPVAPVVINPRGFRSYVRNDVFFSAIPRVLKERPEAVFVCTGMRGNGVAERWVKRLGIGENVRLLPPVTRPVMGELFRLACVTVSPSLHDGTPNTLLEAMACGCFPVAGDIESVREWIDGGVNGLLYDPGDSAALARAILRAVEDRQLHEEAGRLNAKLIRERAEYGSVMLRAEKFYQEILSNN